MTTKGQTSIGYYFETCVKLKTGFQIRLIRSIVICETHASKTREAEVCVLCSCGHSHESGQATDGSCSEKLLFQGVSLLKAGMFRVPPAPEVGHGLGMECGNYPLTVNAAARRFGVHAAIVTNFTHRLVQHLNRPGDKAEKSHVFN